MALEVALTTGPNRRDDLLTFSTTTEGTTMTDIDQTTTREVRITFTSCRPDVRDRPVLVEMFDGAELGQRAYEFAIADLAGTRDLDGTVWTREDLLATDARIEVL